MPTKTTFLATTMLVWAGAAHAQTTGRGSIDGLPYVTLTSPGGCSATNPCQILEYLHPLGEQDKAPDQIQRYFNTTAFWSSNPHTIVVAPMIPGSSSTNNWGDVSAGINGNMSAAVDLVQQIKSTVPTTGQTTLTGGSMGAIGGEQLMSLYGPKGSQQAGVYDAGLFYDGAPYQISTSAMKSTLCGIPLTIVHGANDTTVSPSPDQSMAQTLSGCPGFTFISVPGMGHGTYSGSSVGLDNPQLISEMMAAAQQGAPVTAISVTASATIAPAGSVAAADPALKPGSGSVTDGQGNVWSITSNGDVLKNGQAVRGGGGTSQLMLIGGTVWGQDNGDDPRRANAGGWFTLGANDWIASATGPSATDQAVTTPSIPISPVICGNGVPSGAFRTINGQVIGPDGKPFIARGINVYDALINEGDAMLAMFPGLNFVRVGIHDYNNPSTYQAFVTQMTSKGIVVEFEDHPDGGGGQDPAFTGSKLAAESAWYASMAATFKNNPYVWFGTFNEPGTQGGSVSDWELATYNAIRNTGNNNPILLEIVGWPGAWNNAMTPSVYASMHNTIWDTHFYGWVARYSTDQATVDKALSDLMTGAQAIKSADGTMPVIIAEYGNSTDGTSIDPNGVQTVTSVVNAGGSGKAGSAAWAWKPGGNADHLQDGGKLTSPYGQQVAMYIGMTTQTCTQEEATANANNQLAVIVNAVEGTQPAGSTTTPPAQVADNPEVATLNQQADASIAQANAIIAAAQAQMQAPEQ
jgi:hypothetical protein